MGYKKAKIYFLSGTGNSYRVAAWLHEACGSKGITSEIIPINIANPKEEIEASPDNLIVLAYPTHGLLPPWSAVKFIFKMPFKKGAHIFCVPTRGCFRLGPLVVPGVAGIASMLTAIILPFKGYHPRGSVSFDMPANMISIHSRLSDKNIQRIITNAKGKADKFYQRLLSGKPVWFTPVIVHAIYLYPAYIIAYFVFFNLIRIKPLNRLFTYTTITHFYRRYNEPETTLKDLLNKKQ